MKIILGLTAVFAGVCLCLSTSLWFWLGLVLMVWGLLQMPSEEEEQARMGRCCVAYRRGWGFSPERRVTVRFRSGHTHGLGECSGLDCRL
jgi:hypothetical protein